MSTQTAAPPFPDAFKAALLSILRETDRIVNAGALARTSGDEDEQDASFARFRTLNIQAKALLADVPIGTVFVTESHSYRVTEYRLLCRLPSWARGRKGPRSSTSGPSAPTASSPRRSRTRPPSGMPSSTTWTRWPGPTTWSRR